MRYSTKLLRTSLLFPLLLSGCLYAKVTAPLDTDTNKTTIGTKIGRASTYSVLWLVAWGNGGTDAAARNGEIKVIEHLDIEYESYLFGTYSKVTTIAYGE